MGFFLLPALFFSNFDPPTKLVLWLLILAVRFFKNDFALFFGAAAAFEFRPEDGLGATCNFSVIYGF